MQIVIKSTKLFKATKLRLALDRAEPEAPVEGWERVKGPFSADPKARLAFEAWQRLRASAPAPDSPGYLEHFDAARQAHRALVALAEAALGPGAEAMRGELTARLTESGIPEGGLVWKRAWEHHWSRLVCEAWGLPL